MILGDFNMATKRPNRAALFDDVFGGQNSPFRTVSVPLGYTHMNTRNNVVPEEAIDWQALSEDEKQRLSDSSTQWDAAQLDHFDLALFANFDNVSVVSVTQIVSPRMQDKS